MILFIRIEGRDLADNPILGMGDPTAGTVVGQWDMKWLKPEFALEASSISYTRLLVEVGQSTSVKVLVNNIGTLDGDIDAVIRVARIDGTTEVIQRPNIAVAAGGIGLISLDWAPTAQGIQWIEVELDNGESAKGPTIDVRPERGETFTEKLFGDVNPIIGSAVGLIFISIIFTGLLWSPSATSRRGSRSEYDWDEYSSEMESDDYGDDEEDELPQKNIDAEGIAPTASLSAAAAALGIESKEAKAEEVDSDWVMGSDGYWWYHDKDSNEWWYKDDSGEIVKFN